MTVKRKKEDKEKNICDYDETIIADNRRSSLSSRSVVSRSISTQFINQLNRSHIQFSSPSSFHLCYIIKIFSEIYNASERRIEEIIEILSADL